MSTPAISTEKLSVHYGDRVALKEVSLEVPEGEAFALLGPNGSGKTTLYRVLSTLIPPTSGSASVLGYDVARQSNEVRNGIGMVFQAPSLDKKLSVLENLKHHAALYGVKGSAFSSLCDELLESFQLEEYRETLAEGLSGGYLRRAEIAKALIHQPRVVLMDEPSTGLDPRARIELWKIIDGLRRKSGVTVVVTTHLLEEAEHVDRIALLDEGSLVTCDTPSNLRSEIEGEALVIASRSPDELLAVLRNSYSIEARISGSAIRCHSTSADELSRSLREKHAALIESITIGAVSLEDVFLERTGRSLSLSASGSAEGDGDE